MQRGHSSHVLHQCHHRRKYPHDFPVRVVILQPGMLSQKWRRFHAPRRQILPDDAAVEITDRYTLSDDAPDPAVAVLCRLFWLHVELLGAWGDLCHQIFQWFAGVLRQQIESVTGSTPRAEVRAAPILIVEPIPICATTQWTWPVSITQETLIDAVRQQDAVPASACRRSKIFKHWHPSLLRSGYSSP